MLAWEREGRGGEMKERSLESFGRNECVCLGERRWPVEGGGEGGNERKERRSFENERIDHDSFWRFVHFVHSLVNVTTLLGRIRSQIRMRPRLAQ